MKTAAFWTAVSEPFGSKSLDDVDLGREVARDFEANFLLANFRLGPGLHVIFSSGIRLQPVAAGDVHTQGATKTPIPFCSQDANFL
jgi:hypothetical protein